MIIVRKKIHISYFHFLKSWFLRYVPQTNKWIYNNVWFLNTIFTNKLQFCLVLFIYKLLAFWTFCFQLIVQFLPFSLVRYLTNNSFHTFEASNRCWVEIFRFGVGWYFVDSKNTPYLLITAIFNPFHWLYLLLIACKTNSFSRLKIISKFVSCKMVFALERQVSRINASSCKGYFLDFIHVECVVNKRSTTSMPPFEGSYTVCTLGFFHWSFVILTLSCIVNNTIKLFLPLFFLSM